MKPVNRLNALGLPATSRSILAIDIASTEISNDQKELEPLSRRLEDQSLTREERVLLRCRLAEELEDRGQFDSACSALGELWQGIGARPAVNGLGERTVAELLLRAGMVSGHLGSARQAEGAQERAKDLISESIT